jgi:malonate transporter
MTLAQIAQIVLPVFGLIGVGYVAAWTGLLTRATGEALADFVFTIPIPLLLFRTLSSAEMPAAVPWGLWGAYFAGMAFTWALSDAVVRIIFGRDGRAGVVAGIAGTYSNLVLIGIPLILASFGSAGAVPLFLLIAIHMPVVMIISTILVERARPADDPDRANGVAAIARKIVVDGMLRNPIMLGILTGSLWRFTGLNIGDIPASIIDNLGAAAVPCALFAMGMSLRNYGIGGNLAPAMTVGLLKLAVMPLVVWLVADRIAHLPPLWTAVAVTAAAVPTGVNAYLMANHFGTGHGLASNCITLTTAAGVVTVALWLRFLGVG